jgi:hypothetical protein
MTDMHETLERITSANAVPSPDSFPSGALSSVDLLARIDERSTTMTDTLTPLRPTEPGKPPKRSRGPLIALAVAAVVLLIIGISSFALLSRDDSGPADTIPPAPAPTTAPIESVLPPDTPPLEVVAALQAAWDAGDMDLAEALISPDSGYFSNDSGPGIAEEIWYRHATKMTVERECSLDAAPFETLGLPLGDGVPVSCNETLISGLQPGRIIGGGFFGAEVADGMVTDFYIDEYVGALTEDAAFDGYRSWMEKFNPDAAGDLFRADGTMIADTNTARIRHNELVAVFVATFGPRTERALPVDTPLLEVVATFQERFATGDIEGYEAIFHPMSGYDSGRDAASSWFAAVTGLVADRQCELVSDTQVRCTETQRSGLAPGTVSEPFTTLWNGADGYVWTVEFPDGPPPTFGSPSAGAGVAEYRAWVEENEPDTFGELFTGVAMQLGTEELRAAHSEMIATYLAATSEG